MRRMSCVFIGALIATLQVAYSRAQTFTTIPPQSFGDPASVETGQEIEPDNQGFLDCMTKALEPSYRHGSTVALTANLTLSSNSTTDAVIVGHGAPGMLCTGDGDSCNGDSSAMLASWNEPDWQKQIQTLGGRYKSLTLFGCDTGQNPILLTQIAKLVGVPVRAPTSIVMCDANGIYFVNGGTWAQSGQSIQQPRSAPIFTVRPAQRYKFMRDNAFVNVSPESIKIVDFKHRNYQQREFTELSLKHLSLLSLIDFEHPFETKARPGAVVTGKLRVIFHQGDKALEQSFVLYNDELLEDLNNPDVFYNVDSTLPQRLSDLSAK